ncbi:tetratricopeptide repeat protein [Streptomyces sp. B6B3]|uniref:tetratricopeptide repeat protein n=1 Tax=Streptomyces sp. B6B3 TaxID=3153570 RepID=UPI00325C3A21
MPPGAENAFLGRQEELAALRADLARASLDTLAGRSVPRARVLLVAGRPGTGRTALAEEFARELLAAGEHPDGLLRARLTDPGGVPVSTERTVRELLAGLGDVAPAGATDEELTAALREALDGRRAVLLLDDVGSAEQLDELIPDTRGCTVVAVARGPLTGVPDVRPCALGGLRTPAALRLLTRGAGDVRVTVDPTAALRLAEECGQLPAALVLAAGWLAAHPDAAVVDAVRRIREPVDDAELGLPESPALPTGPSPTGPSPTDPRPADPDGLVDPDDLDDPESADPEGRDDHEDHDGPSGPRALVPAAPRAAAALAVEDALRRAFRMAYAMLPTPAARLLRLLALTPAGRVDAHIAAALAGGPVGTARATLADLARLGFLRTTPAPATAGRGPAAGEPEYLVPGCLDPLLRALLGSRERPADALLARARMLERLVRLLRACQAVTEPPDSAEHAWLAEQPSSLRFPNGDAAHAWLTARLPVLLAAARLATADGELDTLARRLLGALTRALIAHRGVDAAAPELYRLHELALRVTERQPLPRDRAAALLNLGDLDARAGRREQALDRYRAALAAARGQHGSQDQAMVGRLLESMGNTYAALGDWERAADWYERALTSWQFRDGLTATARLRGRLGGALARTEQWPESLRAWRGAAAAHRRLGDVEAQARALGEAARVQAYAGSTKDSVRTGQEALRLAEQLGDPHLQAALRLDLADRAETLGRDSVAAAHRAAAERLLRPSRLAPGQVVPRKPHTYETQTTRQYD